VILLLNIPVPSDGRVSLTMDKLGVPYAGAIDVAPGTVTDAYLQF
jgi:hypothetical protein